MVHKGWTEDLTAAFAGSAMLPGERHSRPPKFSLRPVAFLQPCPSDLPDNTFLSASATAAATVFELDLRLCALIPSAFAISSRFAVQRALYLSKVSKSDSFVK